MSDSFNCPKCSVPMSEYKLETVSVDFCSRCKGMWLDKGELARSCGSTVDFPDLKFSRAGAQLTSHKCPKCSNDQNFLVEMSFAPQSNVKTDVCYKCEGVWVDFKELQEIQKIHRQHNLLTQRNSSSSFSLLKNDFLRVRQRFEPWEWIGLETRNKYEVVDELNRTVAFAAEQGKGILGMVFRHFLGHWRSFEIYIFDRDRKRIAIARQPFRFIFQRLEVIDEGNKYIGAIQLRFSIFTKRFDVVDVNDVVIMSVSSPIFKLWTFPFFRNGVEVAKIYKEWSGVLTEAFTDKDTFSIDYIDRSLSGADRLLLLAAAFFIDLRYFETKARSTSRRW